MFVDRALITVRAGKGGNGHVSFRREKGEPKGGPSGGDGGHGGSVVLFADEGMTTLYDFRGNPLWIAQDGEPGGVKQCHGANAPDLIVRVPPGTQAFDEGDGSMLCDLKPGERAVVAQGGKGGFGNEHFKSATNQTPRNATPGEPGIERRLRLELKVIAEVGFVGLPNAGKSTLLASLTRANPKIANYPFTTLSPQLGIAELDPARRVVLADIPGLIEGASRGAGLGHDFLRHLERTRVLVHLVDIRPEDESDPVKNYQVIRAELAGYSPALAEKPELIAITKTDLIPDAEDLRRAVGAFCSSLDLDPRRDVLPISAASRQGLGPLLERVWAMLHPPGRPAPATPATPARSTKIGW